MNRKARFLLGFVSLAILSGALIVVAPGWAGVPATTVRGGGTGTAMDDAPEFSELMARYDEIEYEQALREERQRILEQLDTIQAGLRTVDDPAWADVARFVAHRYYRTGQRSRAVSLFTELANNAPALYEVCDSLRMLAQQRLALADTAGAESHFDEVLDLAATSLGDDRVAILYQYASQHGAMLKSLRGDFAGAVAVRADLLSIASDRPILSADERRSIYLENARDMSRLGRAADSIEWYDRMLREFPDYGHDDGQIVNLLFERLKARQLPTVEYLAGLRSLWDDPELAVFPQSLVIGHRLGEDFLGAGPEWVDLGNQIHFATADRAARLWSTLDDEDREKFTHVYAHALLRVAMMMEQERRFDEAISYYAMIGVEFPWHDYAPIASESIDRCTALIDE